MTITEVVPFRAASLTLPQFLLGAPMPSWLWYGYTQVPLFVSHVRLTRYKRLRSATTDWALDSGGYSELSQHGRWRHTARDYTQAVARYDREIGRLLWAAPMDSMCESWIIHGGGPGPTPCPGTGLSVQAHQRLTVENYLELRELWPQYSDSPCPFIPVLQGDPDRVPDSHLECAGLYRQYGVDLTALPLTGVGSVCRIQSTQSIGTLARGLQPLNLNLHWFGLKLLGLEHVWPPLNYAGSLTSFDSQAWSKDARHSPRRPGCTHVGRDGTPNNCANCLIAALAWRRWKVLETTGPMALLDYARHAVATWPGAMSRHDQDTGMAA